MAGLSPTAARWDELWDFFLTAFCRWFLEHKPKENATVPWVHDACEIYLGEYTVDIVQVIHFLLFCTCAEDRTDHRIEDSDFCLGCGEPNQNSSFQDLAPNLCMHTTRKEKDLLEEKVSKFSIWDREKGTSTRRKHAYEDLTENKLAWLFLQISNEWKTVLVILYCLTFAVGVIGNISVLIILLVNKVRLSR